MRSLFLALLTLTSTALAEPISLFDGKTLDGWDFDPKVWRVEDGVITGGSTTEKIRQNDFISTQRSYSDFELRLKIKCSGDPKTGLINSGIQIRSRRDGHAMIGYQIDCGAGWFGKIYDEHRRNKVVYAPSPEQQAALDKVINVFGWNEYRIRAEGPHILAWINGVQCIDYTEQEPGIVQDGSIAPQVHSGGICQVQFKDVVIEELLQPSPLELSIEGAELAPPRLIAKTEPLLKAWYPRIRHILAVNYDTPKKVTLRFKNMPGVAHTTGTIIEASSSYFKSHPDDVGALLHELVHVIQAYPTGSPGWMVEGIADYVRYHYAEPTRGMTFKPDRLRPYTGGYDPAAALLAKAQGSSTGNLIGALNSLAHQGKLTEDSFEQTIGKPAATIWEATLGGAKQAEAGKPAKRDISYNNVQGTALTAEEQLKKFHLPEGYEIELVAKESDGIGKFVSVYFDQRGRMWTQTALEYPVDANENPAAAEAVYAGKGKDKVLVYPREALTATLPASGLTNPTVFADGLAIPLGMLPWGNGDTCYIQHGHDLKLYKDTNGDGKADTFDVVLTGFGVQDSHLFPHQFTRAPGGWIWMAQGLFNNSKVRKPGEPEDKAIDWPKCSMARMRPDGSEFEVTSVGPNNIWGLVITGEGETFIQEANDYGYPVMPFHEYTYYPGGMESYRKSYQPELPPQAEFRMGGTGLSGLALLEGKVASALAESGEAASKDKPEAAHVSAKAEATLMMAVANPIISKIQTVAMHREPSSVTAPNGWHLEQAQDLVTCDDPFFRPVALTNGPDGYIYIVDWYNKIISHNEVPRAHPDRDKSRGRIWRVKPKANGARLSEAAAQRKHDDSAKPQPAVAAKPASAAEDPSAGQGTSAAASESRAPASHIDIPDFTKLSTEELIALLGRKPTARAHLAWQTLADRELFPMEQLQEALKTPAKDASKLIQLSWLIAQSEHGGHGMAKAFKESSAQVKQQLVTCLESNTDHEISLGGTVDADGLRTALNDSAPGVRQAAIKHAARFLKPRSKEMLALLLGSIKPSLSGPTTQSSRGSKQIPTAEAYDREFERFLVRMFLERHPEVVAKFLDAPEAAKLPVEALVLASLALEPKASASRVAKLLPQLDRAPNDEELLRLAQFPDEAGCGDALKALLSNAKSRAVVADKLLAQKTKLDAAKIAPLLNDAAKALLAGKDDERAVAVGLIAGFQLTSMEPDLVAMVKQNTNVLAALQALRELRSGASEVFADMAKSSDAMIRDEALAALAVSRNPNAAEHLFALYPSLTAAQRRSALNALSASKPGAQAIVAALAADKLPKSDLDGPTAERLSLVLGNDPTLVKLMASLGHVFHDVLAFDGSDEAWIDSQVTLDGPFTIEAWIKLAPGIDNNDSLLGTPGGIDLNFFGGKFRIYGGSKHHDLAVAVKPITPELWTHVAVTRDAQGICRLYQNGELEATSKVPAPDKWQGCRLGWSGPKKGTEGFIAEPRLWKVARTPAEIRAHFDRSIVGQASSLTPVGQASRLSPVGRASSPSPVQRASSPTASGNALPKSPFQKGARLAKTTDYPPILTPEQAAALDTKFARFSALGHKPGNVANGKMLSALCLACHQVGNTGGQIGPNLSGAGAMGLEAVLRNILTPNAAMEPGYRIFRVEMKSGDLVDAFYVSEDKEAYVIRQPGLQDRRVAKKEVRSTRYIRRSLMPEGLLDGLNDTQVTDLLSYLMTLKG